MRARSLDEAALAAACRTTPEELEGWLTGAFVPRPASLLRLARSLGLGYAELTGQAPEPAPQVVMLASRARVSSELEEKTTERMLESAHYARRLRAFLPANGWARAQLSAPVLDSSYVRQVAQRTREQVRGVAPGVCPSWDASFIATAPGNVSPGPLWAPEGAQLLAASQVLVVPLLASQRAYPAALVRDPTTDVCTAFVDVTIAYAALSRTLAVLYGCALALPALPPAEAREFGEALADELVGSREVIRRAVARHPGHRLADVLELEGGPLAFIRATRRELHSPVFEAFDAMQRADGGRDHAAMLRLLQAGAADGYALTGALWFGEGWEARAREAGLLQQG